MACYCGNNFIQKIIYILAEDWEQIIFYVFEIGSCIFFVRIAILLEFMEHDAMDRSLVEFFSFLAVWKEVQFFLSNHLLYNKELKYVISHPREVGGWLWYFCIMK